MDLRILIAITFICFVICGVSVILWDKGDGRKANKERVKRNISVIFAFLSFLGMLILLECTEHFEEEPVLISKSSLESFVFIDDNTLEVTKSNDIIQITGYSHNGEKYMFSSKEKNYIYYPSQECRIEKCDVTYRYYVNGEGIFSWFSFFYREKNEVVFFIHMPEDCIINGIKIE